MRTIQGKSAWIQIDAAVTILDRPIGDQHGQEMTVHHDVALAAVDFLALSFFGIVIAARPGRSHDLDGLAVDDAERWAGVAPLKLAHPMSRAWWIVSSQPPSAKRRNHS